MRSQGWSFLVAFLLLASGVLAQDIQFSPGFSWRAYNGTVTPPLCPDRLCHFYPTNSNDQYYTEFATWTSATNNPNSANGFLNFRVMFPAGYNQNDTTKKYPVILFLHGAGESGRVWQGRFNYAQDDPLIDNNSRSLIHGGNEHRTAVQRPATDPRSFPGIVIFPQASYSGSWSDSFNNGILSQNQEFIIAFIEHIIENYQGDINKIAIHGLSNGAKGTWDTAMKRPDLFAAVQAFSGVPNDAGLASDILLTTPIRLYQGGLDVNPNPGGAETTISTFNSKGAFPEYFLYPTLGHNTWTTAMARTDFFTWIKAQDKRNIYIFGGSPGLCNEPGAFKKLGFSAGFLKYQWTKDGVDLANDTTRYLTTSDLGTYTVKFMRRDSSWHESFPVTIMLQGASSYSPSLTNEGSLILPYTKDNGTSIGSIGQTVTNLIAPAGFSEYTWYKDNVVVATNTSNTRQISSGAGLPSDAGVYTVSVQESSGCESLISNSKTLIYNSNALVANNPTGPWHTQPSGGAFTGPGSGARPITTILSENKIQVNWTSTFTNEEYFEIWRYRRNQNGYTTQDWKIVGVAPANATQFIDQQNGLRPNAQYGYVIRAMTSNDGRFSNQTTTVTWPLTQDDFIAPTAPTDLTIVDVTSSTVTISWSPSTDNDVIHRYEVFLGSTSVGFSQVNDVTGDQTDGNPAPATSYTFTGLDPNTPYTFNVRAIDFRGNKSNFSQSISATTELSPNGLTYRYYTWNSPTNIFTMPALTVPSTSPLTLASQGNTPVNVNGTNGFDLSPKGTRVDRYAFVYEGMIEITEPGVYQFRTISADGSRLYLGGLFNYLTYNGTVTWNLVVNNNATRVNAAPVPSGQVLTTTRTSVTSNYTINTPGFYPIKVEYYENTGTNEILEVYYKKPSDPGVIIIPLNVLYRLPAPLTRYYSKATGDLNALATWGTNTNGTGTAPTNFTNPNQYFEITNRTTTSLDNAWTVSGASSRVIVGAGVTLTLNAAMSGKMYANANSTINLSHASMPSFAQLDPTSTVNMNTAGDVPIATYGNLNLKTNSTIKDLPFANTQVLGTLTIDDGVTLRGKVKNESSLSVGGNITFNGGSGSAPSDDNRYSLLLTGPTVHTINTNQLDLSLYSLEADIGATVNFNFNTSDVKNITLGRTNGSGGLVLRAGSTLNLGQNNLTINGSFGVNPAGDNGEINVNGGNITLNTVTNQGSNLAFGASNNLINNLSLSLGTNVNGSVTVSSAAQLRNLLTLPNGTLTLNDNLKLLSDATGTARIGPLTASKIVGNITMQRYMEGEGEIFRYISSPVKGMTVEDIQQFIPVTGTFTGSDGPTASLFHYHNTGYLNFPETNGTNQDTLRRGKGYSILVREAVDPTTWEATGAPHQGTIPFTLTGGTNSPNDGWNLLGNPYAAPIKWLKAGGWTSSNVSQTVYIRENFVINNVKQYRFRVYNPSVTPVRADYAPFNGEIAAGQAFWVQTTSASPSLTISETAKETSDFSFFKSADDDRKDVLGITLTKGNLSDVAYILYTDEGTENYEKIYDAVKSNNSFFNLSTLSKDNISLAINATPEVFCEKQTRLNIANATVGNYKLSFEGVENFRRLVKLYLKDNFTGTQVEITPSLTYDFAITSNAASTGKTRFVIIENPILKSSVSLTTNPVCETDANLMVIDAQPGAHYQAFYNGVAVSEKIKASADSTVILLSKQLLGFGAHEITLTSSFGDCAGLSQNQLTSIRIDTLNIPQIGLASGILTSGIAQADQYQWYLDGHQLKGETSKDITPVANGIYEVEVSLGTCFKKSAPYTYVVTALTEEDKAVPSVYPNPFKDTLVVVIAENDATSITIINMMGQPMKNIPVGAGGGKYEVDMADVPAGAYIVTVGAKKYKVIKQQ